MNIDNCSKCGRLYQKNLKNLCPNCLKEIDKLYDVCADYLRKNTSVNLSDLSENTGVPFKIIRQFILEGRILVEKYENLRLKCQTCGVSVKESKLCDKCRNKLSKSLNEAQKSEKITEEKRKYNNAFQIKEADR